MILKNRLLRNQKFNKIPSKKMTMKTELKTYGMQQTQF